MTFVHSVGFYFICVLQVGVTENKQPRKSTPSPNWSEILYSIPLYTHTLYNSLTRKSFCVKFSYPFIREYFGVHITITSSFTSFLNHIIKYSLSLAHCKACISVIPISFRLFARLLFKHIKVYFLSSSEFGIYIWSGLQKLNASLIQYIWKGWEMFCDEPIPQ